MAPSSDSLFARLASRGMPELGCPGLCFILGRPPTVSLWCCQAGVGHSSEAIERAAQAPAASSSEVARPGMGSAVRNLSAVLESFAGLGMSQGSQ